MTSQTTTGATRSPVPASAEELAKRLTSRAPALATLVVALDTFADAAQDPLGHDLGAEAAALADAELAAVLAIAERAQAQLRSVMWSLTDLTDSPGEDATEDKDLLEVTRDLKLPHIEVGTAVRYWPGLRAGDGQVGRTRSEVQLLGAHTPVVWIEGVSSCIALTHVQVLSGDQDQGSRRDAGEAS